MRKGSLATLVIAPLVLLLCSMTLAQDNSNAPAGLSQNANIGEVMDWVDKNGLAQARIGVRTSSQSDKAQLLGTWRTEFKSSKSQEDVVLTMFAPGQTEKMQVWKAETLTFTFESKETSEKFTAAFRRAIQICQPINSIMR